MKARVGLMTFVASIAVLLAGCATAPVRVPPSDRPGPLPAPLQRFAGAAERTDPAAYAVETGSIRSAYGCTVAYEYYEPAHADPRRARALEEAGVEAGIVVLGHGFMRDLGSMRGWAQARAADGIRTVVVTFCNSTWFDGRHERNAEDMIAVADFIAPGAPVLYAGFSAGGLSALLAAASDTRAVAYLGLDPVDSGGLAGTVKSLRMPALYLYGEPSSCNAENNMIPATPDGGRTIALQVPFATHCDFENPTDEACARFCGSVEPPVDAETRRTIGATATAWVQAQLGASPSAIGAFHARTIGRLAEAGRVRVVANE